MLRNICVSSKIMQVIRHNFLEFFRCLVEIHAELILRLKTTVLKNTVTFKCINNI
jgi:hypothetical protein